MYEDISFEIPEEVIQDVTTTISDFEDSEQKMWNEYFIKVDAKKIRELAHTMFRNELPFSQVTLDYIEKGYNQVCKKDYEYLNDLFDKKLVMLKDVKSLKRDHLALKIKEKYPEFAEKILREEVNEAEVEFLLEQKQVDIELINTEIEKWRHTLEIFYKKLGNEESK